MRKMHRMNKINFDLNLLRVFDAMMTERNVTRAARRVFLSQPATSHALTRLRGEIGDELFIRTGREMVPTAKALALAPTVRDMLERLTDVLDGTTFDPKKSSMVFRISMVDMMEYLLAPMFAHLIQEEAPHIHFAIQGYESSTYQQQLSVGLLDIAIGLSEPASPSIYSSKLAAFSPVGLVRKNHPLTLGGAGVNEFGQTPRLKTDLRTGVKQGFEYESSHAAGAGEAANSSAFEAIYRTAHFFAVPLLLASTDLLLVTSEVVAQLLCAQYPLITVPLPANHPPLEIHIFWHQRTHNDPAHRWMREKIMESARSLSAP